MRKFSKLFEEKEISDISNDRVSELISQLSAMSSDISQKVEFVDSLVNELDDFRRSSTSKNDQIDDCIANLQLMKKLLLDSLDKSDNVVIGIKDYEKNGRKFLY